MGRPLMAALPQDILQVAPYREWLRAKQPDEVVGIADQPHDCPVARYMNAKLGIKVWVDKSEAFLLNPKDNSPNHQELGQKPRRHRISVLPRVFYGIVLHFDHEKSKQPITAQEVLDWLDWVSPEKRDAT